MRNNRGRGVLFLKRVLRPSQVEREGGNMSKLGEFKEKERCAKHVNDDRKL